MMLISHDRPRNLEASAGILDHGPSNAVRPYGTGCRKADALAWGGSMAIIRRVINPDSWGLKESTEANKEEKPIVESAFRVPNGTGRQRQAKPQHLLSHHPRPAYTYIHHSELPSLNSITLASSARSEPSFDRVSSLFDP